MPVPEPACEHLLAYPIAKVANCDRHATGWPLVSSTSPQNRRQSSRFGCALWSLRLPHFWFTLAALGAALLFNANDSKADSGSDCPPAQWRRWCPSRPAAAPTLRRASAKFS